MSLDHLTVVEIAARLDLRPHPEGGWFRETFRDAGAHGGRSHSTAIYYLLGAGDRSEWHRVDAVEVWHYYRGAALELCLSFDGRTCERVTLGPDAAAGEVFQAVVPRHVWQSARSLGGWSLIGCTVAPAFDFAGFEVAPAGFDPR